MKRLALLENGKTKSLPYEKQVPRDPRHSLLPPLSDAQVHSITL
jgi:hypothetical protein